MTNEHQKEPVRHRTTRPSMTPERMINALGKTTAWLAHMNGAMHAAFDIFAERMKYIERVRESSAAEWECNPEDVGGTVEQVLRELHGPDRAFSWRDIPEGVLDLDIQSRWTDPRTQGDAA